MVGLKTVLLFFLHVFYTETIFTFMFESCSYRLSTVQGKGYYSPFYKTDVGILGCAVQCRKYRQCGGFEASSGSCVLYTKRSSKVNLIEGQKLYLIWPDSKRFGDQCSNTSECGYRNGQCLYGACTCVLGYSYDFDLSRCVTRCSSYGSSFTMYKGVAIKDCNVAKIYLSTEEECLVQCRDQRRFVCINFEFKIEAHTGVPKCHMCNMTLTDVQKSHREISPNWNLYYRHCRQ